MRIIEKRFLRGPNLFAATPCLKVVVQLEEQRLGDVPGFAARLLALLPELPREFSARLVDGAHLADALEPVIMELQRLAGAAGSFSQSAPVNSKPGQYCVVCGYRLEQVAGAALVTAVDLLGAVTRGEQFDLDAAVAALHETAQDYAIGTSTAAVLVPIA
jgi:cyanophycin synthetase